LIGKMAALVVGDERSAFARPWFFGPGFESQPSQLYYLFTNQYITVINCN
jgi:hypothetical protein